MNNKIDIHMWSVKCEPWYLKTFGACVPTWDIKVFPWLGFDENIHAIFFGAEVEETFVKHVNVL